MTTQNIKRFALGFALMLGAAIMPADLSVAQAEQNYPIGKTVMGVQSLSTNLSEALMPRGPRWLRHDSNSKVSPPESVARAEQLYPNCPTGCMNRSHFALAEYDYPGGKDWFGRKQAEIAQAEQLYPNCAGGHCSNRSAIAQAEQNYPMGPHWLQTRSSEA
jgi:hypothetical protein